MIQKYWTLEAKYFTKSDYNKFTDKILHKKVGDKSDISGFTDNSDLDKQIATLATVKNNKNRIKSRAR